MKTVIFIDQNRFRRNRLPRRKKEYTFWQIPQQRVYTLATVKMAEFVKICIKCTGCEPSRIQDSYIQTAHHGFFIFRHFHYRGGKSILIPSFPFRDDNPPRTMTGGGRPLQREIVVEIEFFRIEYECMYVCVEHGIFT